MPPTSDRPAFNVGVFCAFSDERALWGALRALPDRLPRVLVSDDDRLLAGEEIAARHAFATAGLHAAVLDPQETLGLLRDLASRPGGPLALIVDMSWGAEAVHAGRAFETWAVIAEQFSEAIVGGLVSLYNRELLIENQMQPALCAHPEFLSASGLYPNPYWMPPVVRDGAVDEQMAFLLGRAVPDYAGQPFFDTDGRSYARGAGSGGLSAPRRIGVLGDAGARWQIRCLGPLRVYRDGARVDWNLAGGAPNKSRTLFAYLLIAGDRGGHADRLGELLWPGPDTEVTKRRRLHHAVAMLRKTLGGKETVLRAGEYYRLNLPDGTWTDVSAFEQTCRRGLALAKDGREADALRIYRAGERLYEGDLFEDIPLEYTHSDLEDWCLPRRRWLREMAIKLFKDASVCLRSLGDTGEALEKCHRALALDAAEEANAEMLRVLFAQGRIEAVTRQYRQYLALVGAAGQGSDCARVYRSLMG